MSRNRVVLAVLDGVGIAPSSDGNAVDCADTPTLDRLFETYPYTELSAAEAAVGLPDGYMGNSEVGHLHIGAGRVVPQDVTRINNALETGEFFQRPALQDTVDHVRETGGTVHVMGIASDGGVHGHIDHMTALIEWLGEQGCTVQTHAFLDGRDVSPNSAEQYLHELEDTVEMVGTGHVATVMGRFYAMDRDTNWERTQKAYDTIISGNGRTAKTVSEALSIVRKQDRNDYFATPTVIQSNYAEVGDGDAIVFTNYRNDRARQLAAPFATADFDGFPCSPPDIRFVSMTSYKDTFDASVLFQQQTVSLTLGECINDAELQQLRVAESQKAPHVTYFFDGQCDTLPDMADTCIIPSDDVDAYDQQPAMQARPVTDTVIDAMESAAYEFILVNYANGDLVGHTGNMEATVAALEHVDACLADLHTAADNNEYTLLVTADHGNCEKLRDNDAMFTAHTLNKVPFCICSTAYTLTSVDQPSLTNIAPTVLTLLDIDIPDVIDTSLVQ